MECFGDSSDDEAGGDGTATVVARDESCGVCSFHPHTEASLLAHVRSSLTPTLSAASATTSPAGGHTAPLQRCGDVLDAVDAFCASRHWMMHVGPEKGAVLSGALRDAMKDKARRCASGEEGSDVTFAAVELGTYCGYASVLMARAFLEMASIAGLDCRLFTAEIDPRCAEIASEMIRLGGVEDLVSILPITYNGRDTDVVRVVEDALKDWRGEISKRDRRTVAIDFLFIDHDKDAYASDLRRLEASGMVRGGTRVVADNVLFAGIDDYMAYVRQRKEEGVVDTRTIPCRVEYSGDGEIEQYRDGVEITDYLRSLASFIGF